MELRWYETYDQDGVESGQILQFKENEEDEWEDVPYERERVVNPNKKGY